MKSEGVGENVGESAIDIAVIGRVGEIRRDKGWVLTMGHDIVLLEGV
jgi:hypothetical protein